MQNQDSIIVVWYNAKTMRQECEVFEKELIETAYKYINMLKELKTCSRIKMFTATSIKFLPIVPERYLT